MRLPTSVEHSYQLHVHVFLEMNTTGIKKLGHFFILFSKHIKHIHLLTLAIII